MVDFFKNTSNLDIEQVLENFSINNKIISTCLNRPVPEHNLYWEGQSTYLDFKVRFLSIPFWMEICYRYGVSLSKLLSNESFVLMEKILHYSEEEEIKLISFEECTEKCSKIDNIELILKRTPSMKEKLFFFIKNYPSVKAFQRGNFLAFYILYLDSTEEFVFELATLLIDLIICGCVIDDLYDVDEDRNNNEPNSILELGDNLDAINQLKELYESSSQKLSKYIPNIGAFLSPIFYQMTFKYLFD